jgi:hypothetical protein
MNTERSLTYARKPVRIVTDRDGLWIAATDLYNLARRNTDRRYLSHFDPYHLKLVTFASEAGPVRLTAVSPLGAVTIAKGLGYPYNRMMDAWVRRVADEIAAEVGHPLMGYNLLADGTLPERPRASSDLYLQWKELEGRWKAERFQPNPYEPSLFDDDPVLRTYDPAGDRVKTSAFIASLVETADRLEAQEPVKDVERRF